jgi:PIN domain nuclease of toxin-antitoxin system
MENPETRIGISAVSVWEAMVAMEKGRIESVATPENTVRAWLRESPFEVIPLDQEIVLLSRTLNFRHDDPADRFIAATAYRLNCTLATADHRLLGLPWLRVLT